MTAEWVDGRPAVHLPYLEEYRGGPRRPYLWLELEGSSSGGPVLGLIDTGADLSMLPLGYATLLGFRPNDLEPYEIHGIGGQVDAYRPRHPIIARLPGLEEVSIPMRPAFAEGEDALWGREDFMAIFGVVVDEQTQMLSLILPSKSEGNDDDEASGPQATE